MGSFRDSSFEISAWLLRPGWPRSALPGFPLGRGEGAEEKARRGARTMRARSLSGHGWPVSEPPQRPREVAGHDARRPRPRGCVLFGYFLLHKQEKVTPSQGCEGSSQGRESGFASTPKVKRKSRWIPAFAGMTNCEAFVGKELDPGLRRDDEIGSARVSAHEYEHHPHPTLPLKGRAKEQAPETAT